MNDDVISYLHSHLPTSGFNRLPITLSYESFVVSHLADARYYKRALIKSQ